MILTIIWALAVLLSPLTAPECPDNQTWQYMPTHGIWACDPVGDNR